MIFPTGPAPQSTSANPEPAHRDTAADDLTEREADANALQGYRDTIARLEANLHKAAYRLEQAEARVNALYARRDDLLSGHAHLTNVNERLTQELALTQDTLRRRGEAVNATGASNDALRAKVARVEQLAAWFEAQPNWNEWGIHRQIRAALADQETQ